MAPASDCAIFSGDSYLQKEVKAASLVHRCPSHRDVLPQPCSSRPVRHSTCLRTTHLCPHCPLHEGLSPPLPPPSPTHPSRLCSDSTFSPKLTFTDLLKGWMAFPPGFLSFLFFKKILYIYF